MELKNKYLTFSILLIFLAHFVNPTHSRLHSHKAKSTKHFVLIHGAGHGAWCWYKMLPLLRSSGHNVTALDLGASGIDPKQVFDVSTMSDYIKPLMEFMTSLPSHEKVVLVSHSYGGFATSLAMEKFPDKVSVSIFIAALMPGPNTNITFFNQQAYKSIGDQMDGFYSFENGPSYPTTYTMGHRYMAERLYQLSPIQDWILATLLIRPLYVYDLELQRTYFLSKKNYGSVSRVYIVIDQDKVFLKDFEEWMIRDNPPTEVRVIKDSDHMVMMSKPNELLAQLEDLSMKYS